MPTGMESLITPSSATDKARPPASILNTRSSKCRQLFASESCRSFRNCNCASVSDGADTTLESMLSRRSCRQSFQFLQKRTRRVQPCSAMYATKHRCGEQFDDQLHRVIDVGHRFANRLPDFIAIPVVSLKIRPKGVRQYLEGQNGAPDCRRRQPRARRAVGSPQTRGPMLEESVSQWNASWFRARFNTSDAGCFPAQSCPTRSSKSSGAPACAARRRTVGMFPGPSRIASFVSAAAVMKDERTSLVLLRRPACAHHGPREAAPSRALLARPMRMIAPLPVQGLGESGLGRPNHRSDSANGSKGGSVSG